MQNNKSNKEVTKTSEKAFFKVFSDLISNLSPRSQEIMRRRYGFYGENEKTLESIGKKFQVTRERIRQIIRDGVKKIKEKSNSNAVAETKKKIEFTLSKNNGIIRKKDLITALAGDDFNEKKSLIFFLDCFDFFSTKGEDDNIEESIAEKNFDIEKFKIIENKTKEILEKENKVLSEDDLFEALSKEIKDLDVRKFFNYLSVSREIKRNPFGKWGISKWSDINPKITWQKSLAILREFKKPMHFTEIASQIDKYFPGKKKAHPQTVHNELIKNKEFVLVGRGAYALGEWGYKRGTVKDVLKQILEKNNFPMKREAILDEILKLRRVKKSTVMINLNNFFVKIDKDKYTVKK